MVLCLSSKGHYKEKELRYTDRHQRKIMATTRLQVVTNISQKKIFV